MTSMKLVGCGGGAASSGPLLRQERWDCSTPFPRTPRLSPPSDVALSMVRDVVERVIPNPTQEDIRELKKEATDTAVELRRITGHG